MAAQDLLAFFAVLALDADQPETIRYRLMHTAVRITRHARRPRLHIDAAWARAAELVTASARIRALPLLT